MSRNKRLSLSLLLITFGVIVIPLLTFSYIKSLHVAEPFQGPGNTELHCDDSGSYMLWYNYKKGEGLKPLGKDFKLRMIRKKDSMEIPMTINTSTQISRDELVSVSVASVELDRAGDYRLEILGLTEKAEFAFAKSQSFKVLVALGVSLLLCVVSVVAACLILAVLFVPAFSKKEDLEV